MNRNLKEYFAQLEANAKKQSNLPDPDMVIFWINMLCFLMVGILIAAASYALLSN